MMHGPINIKKNLIVVCDHLGYNWNISDNEGSRFLYNTGNHWPQ